MKFLKKFNEDNSLLEQIEAYLKKEYTSDWFDSQLHDRVYEYISEEEAEDYDGDYEEAYKNLSTGGAIEYDLLEEMIQDVIEKFSISRDQKLDDKRDLGDVVNDHLFDQCTWKDTFIFNKKSSEPYISMFDQMFKNPGKDSSSLGNFGDIKF